jgi:2-dehydropantoate 2-reductase
VAQESIAVVGAGAVGMTIGAAFAAAGHEVIACSRRAPRDNAIILEDGTGCRTYPVRWLTDPGAEPVTADWIVLATKIQHTVSATHWLAALSGRRTRIIAAQNGVDHRDRLRTLTPAPVAPALVYYNAERIEPGRVRVRVRPNETLSSPPTPLARWRRRPLTEPVSAPVPTRTSRPPRG